MDGSRLKRFSHSPCRPWILQKLLIPLHTLVHSVVIHTNFFHTEALFQEFLTVTSSISSASGRSFITLATGFLGAFIVGSLAVQLVRSQTASVQAGAAAVDPVIAGPAALWAPLAEPDTTAFNTGVTGQAAATISPAVEPVVGSEATLWSALGER